MKFEGFKLLSLLLAATTVHAGVVRKTASAVIPSTTSDIPTPTTTDPNSSPPPSCVNTPGSTARVTKTLHFDDIDGTQASRVPIPQGYNGFTFSDPGENKVYMAGSSATVSSPNLLYVNKGKLTIGAVGFPFNPQYFSLLTFLDGVSSARLVISGVLVQPFEQIITADRQYVRVNFPPYDRITAVSLDLTLYAGDSTTQTIPFWIDDFVYVRREWQITCCQMNNPNKQSILKFDDIRSKKIPKTYKGFSITPRNEVTVSPAPAASPSKPKSLKKAASANPLTFTSKQPFNLLSLTVTIPQYSLPPFTTKQTSIVVKGYTASGSEKGSWQFPANTLTPGPFSIDLGGNWQNGISGGLYVTKASQLYGGGGDSGQFSSGGFRGVTKVEVWVEEVNFGGPGGQQNGAVRKEFWVDDFRTQKPWGCEEDF